MAQLWTVYLDDSADGEKKKYVVAGCLIGRKQDWSAFFKQWRKALAEKPAIKYYHGKDLKGLKGPFAQFRNRDRYPNEQAGWDAAYQKRDRLRAVIDESYLIGFGVGVRVPEYMKIRDSHSRGRVFMSSDPFVFVLQCAIYHVAIIVQDVMGARARIAFISDDSPNADEYTRIYKDWKKWNPNTGKSMLGISHLDDEKYWGLQAADLAATTVNGVYKDHWDTGTIQESFPLKSRMWRVAVADEAYILKILDNQSVREPEKKGWAIPKN